MTEARTTTETVEVKAPSVTVAKAVSHAAKSQRHTAVAALLVVMAYLLGVSASPYCRQLLKPPTVEQILE